MLLKNNDIREAARQAGVNLWQIAYEFGVTDSHFSRRLRRELSRDEKSRIFDIIDKLKREGQKNDSNH